jgi:hypothetical protein
MLVGVDNCGDTVYLSFVSVLRDTTTMLRWVAPVVGASWLFSRRCGSTDELAQIVTISQRLPTKRIQNLA